MPDLNYEQQRDIQLLDDQIARFRIFVLQLKLSPEDIKACYSAIDAIDHALRKDIIERNLPKKKGAMS